MSSPAEHDSLAVRLTSILLKLNQGEPLDPQALAQEFNVTLRTIQRDLNERLAFLPLEKDAGRYVLDTAYLGRLTLGDLERFAHLAGIRELFPSWSDDFLRELFDSRLPGALLFKGPKGEDLSGKAVQFRTLQRAIRERHCISFDYSKRDSCKSYADVQPYKLVNHSGIWYLAGVDEGRIKSFTFGKIHRLMAAEHQPFASDPAVEQQLLDDDGIWLKEHKQEVLLQVDAEVADYFRRRSLLDQQQVVEELPDGGLILSTFIAHPAQLFPIVRYWLPHARILQPAALQEELTHQLHAYLAHAPASS